MAYDIETDRQWKRVNVGGFEGVTMEVRDLLVADFRKLTTVGWLTVEEDGSAEVRRIFGENIRKIEGLAKDGEQITTGESAWDNATERLLRAMLKALILASTAEESDLGN